MPAKLVVLSQVVAALSQDALTAPPLPSLSVPPLPSVSMPELSSFTMAPITLPPSLTLPSLSLPSVSLPSSVALPGGSEVTLPSVTLPTLTLPPSVTLPSLTLPGGSEVTVPPKVEETIKQATDATVKQATDAVNAALPGGATPDTQTLPPVATPDTQTLPATLPTVTAPATSPPAIESPVLPTGSTAATPADSKEFEHLQRLNPHKHRVGTDPSHGAHDFATAKKDEGGILSDTLKPFVIPIIGLIVGAVMMQVEKVADAGKLVLYFGAQSFMNIFMGWVLGTHITVEKGTRMSNGVVLEKNLTGCPAGFALTAMQQMVSFVVFCMYFGAVYFTPYRFTPKPLKTPFEIFCVVIFGCVFALNIALNNFSLGYISIAVNLIIRSCLPLTTFLSQQGLAMFKLYPFKPCKVLEISLMVIGVICAGVFTIAQIMASSASGGSSEAGNQILGVVMCIASLLCGSLNLALAGVLGETKLNVYDTVAYMAIPATVFLLPIACFVQKPVPGQWPTVFGKDTMSDWEILVGVWGLNKNTIAWLFLSGVFSFAYNIVQFSIVHTLSPSATAFGGNFNKAALIFMTLLLPFLQIHKNPGSPYIQVIWGAVICNIAAFSLYSYLQIIAKREAEQKGTRPLVEDQDDDGSSEGSSSGGEE